MDNTVTQEVFKRVDALAEKLGTTAGYMWPKLVNYTAWRAGADIMAGFILVIVFAYATTRLYKYWKKELDHGEPHWMAIIILAIATAIFTTVYLLSLPDNIAAVLYPESSAFYRLVGK